MHAAMRFYRRSSDVAAEVEEMLAEGKKTKPLSDVGAACDGAGDAGPATTGECDSRPTTVRQLFSDADLRQPLFIACALVTIQQFSGINAVRTGRLSPASLRGRLIEYQLRLG